MDVVKIGFSNFNWLEGLDSVTGGVNWWCLLVVLIGGAYWWCILQSSVLRPSDWVICLVS